MKKKLFTLSLLTIPLSSFAAPISTPNAVNDTPIVSSGGGTVGGGQCQAYQSNGSVVNLSGGETLIFYGGGNPYIPSAGGYLSTKATYSGTAYVKTKYFGSYADATIAEYFSGKAIGLFARNSDQQSDFIAGAGASGGIIGSISSNCTTKAGKGGGWYGEDGITYCDDISNALWSVTVWFNGGNVYSGGGFFDNSSRADNQIGGIGFFNGVPSYHYFFYEFAGGGGASSVSAFYNYYTKQYTSLQSSYTITGGGIPNSEPTLYVCK